MEKRNALILEPVLAALSQAGLTRLCRLRQPQTSGTQHLEGLSAPVEILRDEWGVPHIYADTLPDLVFAQGFVHAQDRFWQMELIRRVCAGRLAEIFGRATLDSDRWMRTIGLCRVAAQEARLLNPDETEIMTAYCAGVNAYLAQGRLPVEFILLRYRPEPWETADSLSWVKFMDLYLDGNWESELLRFQLVAQLGDEKARELELDGSTGLPPILADLHSSRPNPPLLGGSQDGVGSNNWAVAGSRAGTPTGMPLLANDMHLVMSLPAIWYENHLVGGEINVTGISLPGAPLIVSGHNGRVAWGFTAALTDVQDLYEEHLRRTPQGQVEYEFQGEWLPAEVLQEEIRVKNSETVVEEVVITAHGPLINAVSPMVKDEPPFALRWKALEPSPGMRSLLAMVKAKDCREFHAAMQDWPAPNLNVVHADTQGNIAYSLIGKVPVRARGDGRLPAPGWTGEYEWVSVIPYAEMPHLFNPPQGYLATANNRVVGKDYPYYLGRDYLLGARVQRIGELITAQEKLDVSDFQRMQFDQVSAVARNLARQMGQLAGVDQDLEPARALFQGWDGNLAVDSPVAALYEALLMSLLDLLLGEKLGELAERYIWRSSAVEWLQHVLEQPASPWFDLGQKEGRDEVLRLGLGRAVETLRQRLGPELEGWNWGKLHTLTFAHVFGQFDPLKRVFNRGPYPIGGDGSTLWMAVSRPGDGANGAMIGPPFRFIADLGDLDHALGLLAPGQSGNLGSQHYDDQVEAWFNGQYHPMLYNRADVEQAARNRLRLLP